MSCDLCNLEHRTRLFYTDSDFTIVECETCRIPMVVYKEHTQDVPERKIKYIKKLSYEIFGKNITFREKQRNSKDHWHCHIEGAIVD